MMCASCAFFSPWGRAAAVFWSLTACPDPQLCRVSPLSWEPGRPWIFGFPNRRVQQKPNRGRAHSETRERGRAGWERSSSWFSPEGHDRGRRRTAVDVQSVQRNHWCKLLVHWARVCVRFLCLPISKWITFSHGECSSSKKTSQNFWM